MAETQTPTTSLATRETISGRYFWSSAEGLWRHREHGWRASDFRILRLLAPDAEGLSSWHTIEELCRNLPKEWWIRVTGNGGYTFTKGHGLRRDFLFEKEYGERGKLLAVRATGLVRCSAPSLEKEEYPMPTPERWMEANELPQQSYYRVITETGRHVGWIDTAVVTDVIREHNGLIDLLELGCGKNWTAGKWATEAYRIIRATLGLVPTAEAP